MIRKHTREGKTVVAATTTSLNRLIYTLSISLSLSTFRADLVPVFSFGENDIYRQVENPRGSRLRRFQETMKAFTGFSPPIFYGRGLLQYTWGYVPFRTRIATVGT